MNVYAQIFQEIEDGVYLPLPEDFLGMEQETYDMETHCEEDLVLVS